MEEPLAAAGFVSAEVRAEFPGLRLDWVTVQARVRESPRAIRQRLRMLSNRYRGASVVAMRTQPIPSAYRTFFRQVGLDPDTTRIPAEEAAVSRLLQGQFRSFDIVRDALLIALIETGVGVWALDADCVDASGLGIRTSREADRLRDGGDVPPGRLVVADRVRLHALLFGEVAPAHQVGGHTSRIALFTVGVDGVPAIHVEEALWVAAEVLAA